MRAPALRTVAASEARMLLLVPFGTAETGIERPKMLDFG